MLGVVILAWQCVVLPFAAGKIFTTLQKKQKRILETYALGWILVMALFCMEAAPLAFLAKSLPLLVLCWEITTACVTVGGGIIGVKNFRNHRKLGEHGKINWYILGLLLVLLVLSYVAVPAQDGDMVESANRALLTDTMYCYDPYSGLEQALMKGRSLAPYEMYYAVVCRMTGSTAQELTSAMPRGIAPAVLMKTIMPAFLIPMFLGIYEWLATYFFMDSKKRVTVIYAMAIFDIVTWLSGRGEGFLLVSGAWHPETILCQMVIPMTFLCGLQIVMRKTKSTTNYVEGQEQPALDQIPTGKYRARLTNAVLLFALALVSELCMYKGVFFWGLTLLVTLVTGIISSTIYKTFVRRGQVC